MCQRLAIEPEVSVVNEVARIRVRRPKSVTSLVGIYESGTKIVPENLNFRASVGAF